MRYLVSLWCVLAVVTWPLTVSAQNASGDDVGITAPHFDQPSTRSGLEWSSSIVEIQPSVHRARAGFIASATVMAAGGLLATISMIEWHEFIVVCIFPPCEPPPAPSWRQPARVSGVVIMVSGAAATIATGALWGVRTRRSYKRKEAHARAARRVQWDPSASRLVF